MTKHPDQPSQPMTPHGGSHGQPDAVPHGAGSGGPNQPGLEPSGPAGGPSQGRPATPADSGHAVPPATPGSPATGGMNPHGTEPSGSAAAGPNPGAPVNPDNPDAGKWKFDPMTGAPLPQRDRVTG